MSFKRALVDCAVLSLQDRHVFYPCCRGCFSRVLQTDTDRWRCFKCGYSCLEQHLEYRYRLSVRVTRDNRIFGLVVFGSCLNHLFGVPATHLHRMVEEFSGPQGADGSRSGGHGGTLLLKAVQDCFIGRRFVFGIKLSGPLPCETAPGSQLIANQILQPLATAPGCSVVSYYRALLHQAAVCPEWSTDPSTAPLLLSSPQDSFNSTLPSCGHSRTLHHTFTHTPTWLQSPGVKTSYPWLQSPGVVTSSAEQESSFEGGGGCRDAVPGRKSSSVVSGCLTPLLPRTPRREERTHNRNFYQDVLTSFCEGPNSPSSVMWAASTKPGYRRTLPSSYRKRGVSDTEEALSEISTMQHVAWEDMPFSESLWEFACNPADNDPDTDHQTWSDILLTVSHPTSHRMNQATSSVVYHSQNPLLDITNIEQTYVDLHHQSQALTPHRHTLTPHRHTLTPHRHTLTPHRHKLTPHRHTHTPHRHTHTPHRHTPDLEEEEAEEEEYNCSADLFHCSHNSTETDTHPTETDTPPTETDTHPTKKHTDTQTHKHTDTQTHIRSDCCDFVPSSQSTPVSRKTNLILQVKAQRHAPLTHVPLIQTPLKHTPTGVAWRLEPRDIVRTLQRQRFHSGAVLRGSSPGGVEMVPPSPAALCSVRSWYDPRGTDRGSEGRRDSPFLDDRQPAGGETDSKGPHSHHTLADRPANQHTCIPDSSSLHLEKKVSDWSCNQEKDVSDWSRTQENGVFDWSRDMFTDSF